MTVTELRDVLDQLGDDDEVCFLLQQHRCNLKYEVTGAGYRSDLDSDDDSDPQIAYLVGREAGYGPSEVDEV